MAGICDIGLLFLFFFTHSAFSPNPQEMYIPQQQTGYEHFTSHLNELFLRCERFFGTSDPLVIEDMIMRLEATIRILRITRDSIDPPLSTETVNFLNTLINQVREILAAGKKSMSDHRQLGKFSYFTNLHID